MITSSMFLSSVTVVDHAYIDSSGRVCGRSYNPTFVVTGKVDATENVVIDFSSVKKDLKAIIDHPKTGFDHKLWVINSGTEEIESDCFVYPLGEGRIRVTSSSVDLDIPDDAVCFIDLQGRDMSMYWDDYLTEQLALKHPNINLRVSVNLETTMTGLAVGAESFTFSYVHGLRDSTSWGCQNNSHGHLSYMQLLDINLLGVPTSTSVGETMRNVCEVFDNAVFIRRENVTLETDDVVTCVYESVSRGRWFAAYNKRNLKTVVLDTETTIEYLVAHIARTFGQELLDTGARYLAVSEGLTKGALFDLANI